MKRIQWMLSFGVALLVLFAVNVYATSPREELAQMVEQLQKTPTDNALREKIIKLAQGVKPAPTVPPEAKRSFVMGGTYQKEAKSPEDFALAVKAFQDATTAAPWWGDAYYNLSVALESAKRYDEAKGALTLYLLTQPKDAEQAQERLYAIDAKQVLAAKQEANSPQAIAARQRRKDEALIRSLNGAKFAGETTFGSTTRVRDIVEIHGQEAHSYREVIANDGTPFQVDTERPSMRYSGDNDKPPRIFQIQGREFGRSSLRYSEISEDGQEIREWSQRDGKVIEMTSQNSTPRRRVR